MKNLIHRGWILSKARAKYIPSQTMNISEALKLYLKNDAKGDEQIPLKISGKTSPKNIADFIGRPDCPGCGRKMMLRVINILQGKQNQKGWKTCWECLNCGYEKYSLKTIEGLVKEGSIKERNQHG